jgi:hypothetical protein
MVILLTNQKSNSIGNAWNWSTSTMHLPIKIAILDLEIESVKVPQWSLRIVRGPLLRGQVSAKTFHQVSFLGLSKPRTQCQANALGARKC